MDSIHAQAKPLLSVCAVRLAAGSFQKYHKLFHSLMSPFYIINQEHICPGSNYILMRNKPNKWVDLWAQELSHLIRRVKLKNRVFRLKLCFTTMTIILLLIVITCTRLDSLDQWAMDGQLLHRFYWFRWIYFSVSCYAKRQDFSKYLYCVALGSIPFCFLSSTNGHWNLSLRSSDTLAVLRMLNKHAEKYYSDMLLNLYFLWLSSSWITLLTECLQCELFYFHSTGTRKYPGFLYVVMSDISKWDPQLHKGNACTIKKCDITLPWSIILS